MIELTKPTGQWVGEPSESAALNDAGEALQSVPPLRIAMLGAAANILLAFVCDLVVDDPYLPWVPLVMMAVTFATCAVDAIVTLLRWNNYLWSSVPWFLASCAVHFGVGPTIYYFANVATVAYMDEFFRVDTAILRKTCILNSVGILVVCLTWRLALTYWPPWATVKPHPMTPHALKRLAFLLLAISLPVKYLFILPNAFGLTDYILPGSVQACGYFTYLVVFVVVYLVASKNAGWYFTLFGGAFLAIEIFAQLLLFSKLAVIQALVMCFFGVYAARPTRTVFYSCLGGLIAAYLVLTPYVNWCRHEATMAETPDIETRLEIIMEYLSRDDRQSMQDTSDVQWSWMRFCLVPMQAFAIDSFDRGNPGESLWLALYVFIPRFLWPGKPIVAIGQTFNILATGYDINQTSPGHWGDVYWNGGWLAVVVACVYIGFLHAVITRIVVPSMKVRDFRALPLAFIGLTMGMKVEDFFVLGSVAPVPICVLYYLVVRKVC